MLDLIIAYVVILLVLSTLTTAMLQLVQRMVPLRYLWLRHSLAVLWSRVLGDAPGSGSTPTAAVSQSRAHRLLHGPGANPLQLRYPDYVGGDAVRKWLRDGIDAEQPKADAKAKSDDDNHDHDHDHRHGRGRDEDRYPDYLCDEFDSWWTTVEKQMSVAFRARLVFVSVTIGLLLSLVTGLEAVSVARHLSESPAEIEALGTDAERQGGSSRRSIEDGGFARMVEREITAAGHDPDHRNALLVCFDTITREIDTETDQVRAAAIDLEVHAIEGQVPEGCPLTAEQMADDLAPAVRKAHDTFVSGLGFGGYPLTEDPGLRTLGHLLMGLFIGLGAPFWFELLNLLRLPLSSRPAAPERPARGKND